MSPFFFLQTKNERNTRELGEKKGGYRLSNGRVLRRFQSFKVNSWSYNSITITVSIALYVKIKVF